MAIQEIEFYVPIKYNPYVEERYEVSTLGHVRNRKTGHVLINQKRRQNGYASICLQIGDGKQVTFYVHILVADAFLPNSQGLPEVNHKDQNKMNPRLCNLERCSRKYNMTYGDIVDRIITAQMKHSPEFICLETGMIYRNQSQAARELGVKRSNLNLVLNGKRKTTGGLHFKWLYQLVGELSYVS